ncbi:hypothetical protein JCM33374_g1638 [Metschnikowia sp. JCM 33374]|nr:hypothetical protein JCM33374_g1638 [Metschnikowia sp. JCM 33374]
MQSLSEVLCRRGSVMAMNAYNFELMDPSPSNREIDGIGTMEKIANAVSNSIKMSTANLPCGEKNVNTTPDIPHKVSLSQAELFYKVTSSYPEVRQLPTKVIISLVSYFCGELQKGSFTKSRGKDPHVCTETVKSWWVYSVSFQEDICVVSEVVALSQKMA